MRFLLLAIPVLLYLQIGYVIAHRAFKIWLAKDNKSLLAFLLFPASFTAEKIGQHDVAILGRMSFHRDWWTGDTPGAGSYHIALMVLWPLKLLYCLPMFFLLLTLGGQIRRFIRGPRNVDKLIARADITGLYEERRRVEAQIKELEDKKTRLTVGIEEIKNQTNGQHLMQEKLDQQTAQK